MVPYNPYLMLKYNCHINVEICSSVKSVKYLYKYVYKGHDRGQVQVVPVAPAAADAADAPVAPVSRDEIKEYVDGRYVSASEAAWRLLGFDLHGITPSVQRLGVHLPNAQQVYFHEGDNLAEVAAKRTPLLAWFDFNKRAAIEYEARRALDPTTPVPSTFSTVYHDVPKIATFDPKTKEWQFRKNKMQQLPVGRMYHVQPSDGERYYLRVLLHTVPGATCFEDLRTTGEGPDSVVHLTFKAACEARGLLQDDAEWARCMEEVNISASPSQLRATFTNILLFNSVSEPLTLWETFKEAMSEDFAPRPDPRGPPVYTHHSFDQALRAVNSLLLERGRNGLEHFGLPVPAALPASIIVQEEIARYNQDAEATRRDEVGNLTHDRSRCTVRVPTIPCFVTSPPFPLAHACAHLQCEPLLN